MTPQQREQFLAEERRRYELRRAIKVVRSETNAAYRKMNRELTVMRAHVESMREELRAMPTQFERAKEWGISPSRLSQLWQQTRAEAP